MLPSWNGLGGNTGLKAEQELAFEEEDTGIIGLALVAIQT
jgi:hypothetical protein